MPKKNEIARLLKYRMCLMRLKELGFKEIFSYYLAKEIGISAEQIRKDLSIFKIKGRKKSGYNIDKLITDIEEIIGKDSPRKIIIIGMGNIGKAIANNYDFINNNIEIIAGFDINPNKIKAKANIPIYHIDELEEIIKQRNISSAIISVQALSAQQVCDKLIALNIKALLNFAPIILKTPEDVIVNNINIYNELMSIIYLSERTITI